MKTKCYRTIMLLTCTFGISGCVEDILNEQDINSKIDDVKSQVAAKVKREYRNSASSLYSDSVEENVVRYSNPNKDPFLISGALNEFLTDAVAKEEVVYNIRLLSDPERPVGYTPGPFEKYELNALKMIGIIGLVNGNKAALVDVGSNKIVTVNVGDYIGKDYGRVVRISENRIDIVEKLGAGTKEDPNAWVTRENFIPLTVKNQK